MKIGITVWLQAYTSSEYTTMSNQSKELAFRLLSVLMLYFNLKPDKYIGNDKFEAARHAAGLAGALFATLSSLDAGIRSKYKDVRIFDELSIACIYVGLWALFYSMYEKISIIFMVLCFLLVVNIFFHWLLKWCATDEPKPKPHKSLAAMFKVLEAQSGDAQIHLINYLALLMVVMKPEDQNTLAVLKIVEDRNKTTPTNAP